MKKLALFFIIASMLSGCSFDDDSSRMLYQLSKVTQADLPESFEKGKSYSIKITYLLPTACHKAAGIEVKRGGNTGDKRRDIYIVGISMYDATLTECTIEEENLERASSFTLFIDENEPYTFYLWDGYDDNDNSQYTTVEVPVL